MLLKEIAFAQEIIASKIAGSILSYIGLEAAQDTLHIQATDGLKVNFSTSVPVIVIEPGTASVFGDKFLGILNSIPDGELEFEQAEGKTAIRPTSKKINFQLKSMASDEFPELPVPREEAFFAFPARDLKEMIQQTVFAVSDDEVRYNMNGVCFEKREERLIMAATDGRRLAFIETTPEEPPPDFPSVIIPPKILHIITKHAGDEGEIAIAVSGQYLFVRFGSYNLSSKLIEGQFPNYQRVIPEHQDYFFTVNRMEMLDALKRVSIFAEQKVGRVYIGIGPSLASVYTDESEIGAAKEEIPAIYDGGETAIALNYRYIEEPLKGMSSNEVSFHFTDPLKALTIKSEPERNFIHVIMPMQQS
jgi:DNA polymerase-3 subunit beta